jgi:hypothetical protein
MIQNFLSTNKFELSFTRLPNVEFFVQGANLPGISSGFTAVPNPFATINRHGDKLDYEDFNVTIRSDENLTAYKEMHNWLTGLTKPIQFEQYKTLNESNDGLYSDASFFTLDSKGNVNFELQFTDIFPIAISGMQFATTNSDDDFALFDVTFKYTYYTIKNLY